MKGLVFNIQRYCIHDGPGIRTTVFMKGCPLRCAWCHNPEGRCAQPIVMFSKDKCALCGACARVCEHGVHAFAGGRHTLDRTKCVLCGKCEDACVYDALELAGKAYETEEIVRLVLRDREFYGGGGGVTFSGGEPLMQHAFVAEAARRLKDEQVNVCVETSGYAPLSAVKAVAEYTDTFLYDIKETDGERHKQATGVDMRLILENLAYLAGVQKDIVLRCPVIPDVNMRKEHFEAIGKLARRYPSIRAVELEPYHPLGIDKAERAGLPCAYPNRDFLKPEDIRTFQSIIDAAFAEGAAETRQPGAASQNGGTE